MKKSIMIIIIIGLLGCSGNPTPTDAVNKCLESKGMPIYRSNCCQTHFVCMPEGIEKISFE